MDDRLQAAEVAAPERRIGWLSGRAGRREFWAQVAILFVVSYLFSYLPPMLRIQSRPLAAILQISPTLILMVLQVRRVHDLGRSGWWAVAATFAPIVLIVPVLFVATLPVASITGVIFELLLLTAIGAPPGDADENRFGPPPPFTVQRVLTGR